MATTEHISKTAERKSLIGRIKNILKNEIKKK
jgi:hypothetical protein